MYNFLGEFWQICWSVKSKNHVSQRVNVKASLLPICLPKIFLIYALEVVKLCSGGNVKLSGFRSHLVTTFHLTFSDFQYKMNTRSRHPNFRRATLLSYRGLRKM